MKESSNKIQFMFKSKSKKTYLLGIKFKLESLEQTHLGQIRSEHFQQINYQKTD